VKYFWQTYILDFDQKYLFNLKFNPKYVNLDKKGIFLQKAKNSYFLTKYRTRAQNRIGLNE